MKRYLVVCVALLAGGAVRAQELKNLFVNMPDSLAPLLTKVNREDFGDFLEGGMKAEVKDRFGGKAEMLRLTDNYLLLKETAMSTVEMKLLPVNDSVNVICVVHTCQAPVADSRVAFYSVRWESLPTADFVSLPVEDDFYPTTVQAETDAMRNLRREADMLLMKASLSATSDSLSFVYTTPDYMEKEKGEQLRNYVRKVPVAYSWKDGKFRREGGE